MLFDTVRNRRRQVELYLGRHGFEGISSKEEVNTVVSMQSGGQTYELRMQREWLERLTQATIDARLDSLQLIPFLQANQSAWVGVTTTGEEVVTHIEPDARA